MKKIDLGQTVAILANVGVIAGIAFLAFELRQNNQLLEVEAVGSLLETRIARQELTLSNPHLIAAEIKNRSGAPLSDEDLFVIRGTYVRSHLGWQKEYLLFQAGLLDEEEFRISFPVMRSLMTRSETTYSGREHWDTVWSGLAAPAYRNFVETCLIGECESIPR